MTMAKHIKVQPIITHNSLSIGTNWLYAINLPSSLPM